LLYNGFNMSSTRIVKAIRGLLFVTVIAAPLFYWKWSLFPYNVPKTALFEALVEIIFALWLALAISDKRYRPRMTPLLWAGAAFLSILTITAFTGVDVWRSFFSDLERAFGIVMYYHLAALALVVSSLAGEMPWKKIWYASFGTSLATVLIALIQLQSPNLLLLSDMVGGRPGATFGNPTFLAGYLLFTVFVAGYYLLRNQESRGKGETLFLWATVIGNILGIFITATRGDILGLFGGIFALVVLFAIRPPVTAMRLFVNRRLYALVAIILVILAGGVWITRGSSIWNGVPGIDRLKDITLSGANSDIGPRIMALSAGWQGFLDRPLTGWGFENFNVVFNAHYDPRVLEYGYAESNFDKPHNIAVEMLTAGGILLFLAYLALFAAFIYEAWKSKDTLLSSLMIAALVAYGIRSLVIFDTLGPAMMLYLAFGWVNARYRGGLPAPVASPATQKPKEQRLIQGPVIATTLIAAAIVVYMLNLTAFAASMGAWDAHNTLQVLQDPTKGAADFVSESKQWSVYQWDFLRDYANTIAQAYFYNPTGVPAGTVKDAIGKMEQVALDHPQDAYNHYLLTDIYNLASTIDPTNYLPNAEKQADIALGISPNRQEIYYYLMKTKSLEGDNAAAFALAKKALDLDPKVADSHFYYGMLAFAIQKPTIGYDEVKQAIALGRTWHDFYEPRVAGDYFADTGHLGEAIGLYQEALKLKPDDADTELKLGAAYYFNKQPDLARQYFSAVVSKYDITSSQAYPQYKPILDALGLHP
jgi:O-antigen ligase/tetratricopeptide (TPR) repeat protein